MYRRNRYTHTITNRLFPLLLVGWLLGSNAALAQSPGGGWPDLSVPPPAQGGGEKDAALIIGISQYTDFDDIPGAADNARDWYKYLTETRKIDPVRVFLVTDQDAFIHIMRDKLKQVTEAVQPGGTLWFIYIGHGFPGDPADPKASGLLMAYNAKKYIKNIVDNSLSQDELFRELSKGKQANTVVLLDACFSGRAPDGDSLLEGSGLQPGVVAPPPEHAIKKSVPEKKRPSFLVMTASKEDEYAGPLPGGRRPAFSYLILGALRGWASYGDGKVTAEEAVAYAQEELRHAKRDPQTPQLKGKADFVLALGDEERPNPTRVLEDTEEPAATPVKLTVNSSPEKADVFVDNFYKGVAPLTIELPRGGSPVTIRVAKNGYQPKEETFTPTEDYETTLTLEIEPEIQGVPFTPVDNTDAIKKVTISAGLGAVGLGAAITSVVFIQKRCQGGVGTFVAKSPPAFAAAAGASFGGLWTVWGSSWENRSLPWLGGAATALGASGAVLMSSACDLEGGSFQNTDTRTTFLIGAGALAASATLFVPTALLLRKEKKANEDKPQVSLSLSPTQGGGLLSFQLTGW